MIRSFLFCCSFLLACTLSAQDFPAETVVCRLGTFNLERPATVGNDQLYQWERSFDGGNSWLAISGANADNLTINNPTAGISYRLRYAPDATCLADASCASLTTATRLTVQITEFFQSAVICQGEEFSVGEDRLTTAGNHETVIDMGGCDSIVHTFVLLNPSYDQLVVATLCPGEQFQGEEYARDTSFQTLFSTENGCDSLITYEIDVSNLADLTIAGPTEICLGETADLSITGQFSSIAWSNGDNGNTTSATTNGTYRATVTNGQGCSVELEHELATYSISANPELRTPACPETASGGINIVASGDEMLLYSFDGGATFGTEASRNNLAAGSYALVVESPLGCQWDQNVELDDAEPINLITFDDADNTIERGDSLQLNVTADFPVEQWEWNTEFGLSCRNCPNPVARPLADTEYTLTAHAAGGCTVTETFRFTVLDSRRYYAPTAFSPNADGQNDHWQLYPGPKTTAIANFTIFDRWGGTLYRLAESLPADDPRLRWDGSSEGQTLSTGTYAYAATLVYENGSSRVVSGTINLMK